MSQSKISKIETGKMIPSLVDVESILRALDAPPALVDEVAELARIANTEWNASRLSWRRGLEKRQSELAHLEAEATEIRYFLPSMITGLLATPEYIRSSLEHAPVDTSKTVERKLKRQDLLYDTSKSLTFILTEQAVKWPIVPRPAMAVQVDRLVSVSHLPSIRLGVIPLGTPTPRGPLSTFTIYDDRLATAETLTGRIVFRDPKDIDQHREIFSSFEENTFFDDDARDLLLAWANSFR
ncbi:transcriptional regulator with XRE-family HTH domain [Nocardiopsis mwathae]|uniref:Transcriptional regulator with XRE-family HTH domain n=2 Tax=Nocardiopsis mwathae TaxID=1472723 RepID=A0A7W9YDA4_9ACTN|nr:transcriptional regulator with XRE-family HTH domain [Nocardiopsis mwathae]